MKIKNDYVLRKVADNAVLVPIGKSAVDFNGMIKLNDTGAYLFKLIQKGADEQSLVDNLVTEYDVSKQKALNDVSAFIKKLRDADIVE